MMLDDIHRKTRNVRIAIAADKLIVAAKRGLDRLKSSLYEYEPWAEPYAYYFSITFFKNNSIYFAVNRTFSTPFHPSEKDWQSLKSIFLELLTKEDITLIEFYDSDPGSRVTIEL